LARRLLVSLLLAPATAAVVAGTGGANGAGEFTFCPQTGIVG
jgi:hypothetical protein